MEKPILFSTPMVQAIMEGRKTMTRRVVKPNTVIRLKNCPYGQVGDVLWVRESWSYKENKSMNAGWGAYYISYKADRSIYHCYDTGQKCLINGAKTEINKWKPSIHMKKSDARIWLEITNIRVERLQDISEQDAISEGVDNWTWKDMAKPQNWMDYREPASPPLCSAYDSFTSLWDSINGEQSWNENPWVWVVEFKRINK